MTIVVIVVKRSTHDSQYIIHYSNAAAVGDDDGTHAWLTSSCCRVGVKRITEGEEEDRECTNQQKPAGTRQSRAGEKKHWVGEKKVEEGVGDNKKISCQGLECVKSSIHIFIHTCANEEHVANLEISNYMHFTEIYIYMCVCVCI